MPTKRGSRKAEPRWQGAILVFDREGRSSVVEAFRRARWSRDNYRYLARDGDAEARYFTVASRDELDRLYAAVESLLREGHGGFELYTEERLEPRQP